MVPGDSPARIGTGLPPSVVAYSPADEARTAAPDVADGVRQARRPSDAICARLSCRCHAAPLTTNLRCSMTRPGRLCSGRMKPAYEDRCTARGQRRAGGAQVLWTGTGLRLRSAA